MMSSRLTAAALALAVACLSSTAEAGCVTKAANATAGSAESAKWFVMETMVQAVSWGLWPGWLSNGKVEGYSVSGERYSCNPSGGQVFCRGRATFCTRG